MPLVTSGGPPWTTSQSGNQSARSTITARSTRQTRPQYSGYKNEPRRVCRGHHKSLATSCISFSTPVILHTILENMSTTNVMTRSNSTTSMSITDALRLSPTNRLTPAERKAFGKSDSKAAKVLGITLTRNHERQANQDRRLALLPSPDQENDHRGNTRGETMALVDVKRPCSRNASDVTIVGPLKDLGRGLASGMGMNFVKKRNHKRRVAEEYTQRVVLGPSRSNESPGKEESSTAGSDDSVYSFLELDKTEDTETPPIAGEFLALEGNDEEGEDDLFGNFPTSGFVWDVDNPFATPPTTALQRYFEEMRLSEATGPLDPSPVAPITNLEASSEEEGPELFSDDSFDDILRPAERAYLDFLITQDEAEEQPMEMRRERRAALRSRNKILDVLGAEAQQAVDGRC
ncbi:uncharacterized protein EDB91DRAFT_201486 [Suillus paluster]|uniref:uncharacterized protein n=1 Tax=Suillus paluster TaxID=48578 RepID=UPI001B874A91|nr:uncharacterized protein EDB91DRAFT_201486 [Suillus paluster]KAG1722793.1 hypothetical protein EDB91DRAFT_201486 [Suillus paluster]